MMKLRKAVRSFLPYCHGPTYHAAPNVELAAGADLHAEQAAIFGERWGLSSDHIYSDYREMLEKENLDIVSVCTTAPRWRSIARDVGILSLAKPENLSTKAKLVMCFR